jgi:catechol 2,3-dioxygenase-like lactoylglutathione lyase family enzyme
VLTAIDHVILPVGSLAEGAAPFERLGMNLTPVTRRPALGTENRAMFSGGNGTEFYLELLAVHDRAAAESAGRDDLLAALRRPAALWQVVFATEDLDGLKARLSNAGVGSSVRHVLRDDGAPFCDLLTPGENAAGCEFAVIEYAEDDESRRRRHADSGLYEHGLALRRLDHLAAIVKDLDGATRFWTDVLGVPVFGEVPMGTAGVIRQMKVGDAILELIGATAPDSPLRARPQGLISMCAFEVADLAAAVATARERGFTCPDPAPGPLPGTRVASVPGNELSGMTLQLLEYV